MLRQIDFYRTAYPKALGEVRSAGTLGATLFEATQGPGDWSDQATGDLYVTLLRSESLQHHHIDLGSGRLRGPVRHNAFAVTPPESATKTVIDEDHSILIVALPYHRLAAMDGDCLLPADGDFGRLHARFNEDAEASGLVMRLWHQMHSPHAGSGLLSDALVLQLAARLAATSKTASRPAAGGLAPRHTRQAQQMIRDHLAEGVSLANLAAAADLSPWHFCRAFKEATGTTPHRAQVLARMERACAMLEGAGASVTEVAHACGYQSSQAFARVFARETGITPSAFRRERMG